MIEAPQNDVGGSTRQDFRGATGAVGQTARRVSGRRQGDAAESEESEEVVRHFDGSVTTHATYWRRRELD
jgi:hypothetical protein